MNYKKVLHFSRNRNSLIYSALSIGIIAVLLGFVIQHNKVPERFKIKRTLQDSCPWLTPSELSKLIETNNYPSLIKVLRLKHGQFFSKVEIAFFRFSVCSKNFAYVRIIFRLMVGGQ